MLDCFCAGRRVRKPVRLHKQIPDVAGGVHVGKDDLNVGSEDYGILFSKTKIRNLMIGLTVGSETAIVFDMKLGDVATTLRTSGFGVETVECKNLSVTVWSVGGHDEVRSQCRHVYRGTNGLIYTVNSNDGSQVVDARDEFNNMINDELRDAFVLNFANTVTPFTATRS